MTAARTSPPVTPPPLPTELHVGPLVYTVVMDAQRAKDAECYGFAENDRTAIVIDPAVSASKRREIVLHEVLHTLMEVIGVQKGGRVALLPDTDDEERLVTALAPWLLDTLRRNPALPAYLLAADA